MPDLTLNELRSLCPGEGAFSTVYKVQRISDGQEYALKKVRIIRHSLSYGTHQHFTWGQQN